MSDRIYLVAPTTKQLTSVSEVSLAELGIKERQDLEAWVISHPDILGEPLLIVTTEFDQFDRSAKRLDILALDKNGFLVVVELKLDLSKSLADQQAIRYAAFCSTMTMEQVVETMAGFLKSTVEDARQRIGQFLEVEELPELGNQPRIILAAGALDDEELTSTVLWLRTFRLDITCVEMKPYRLPSSGELILVPRIIIPLPEAKTYQVRVEQKQAASIDKSKEMQSLERLWNLIATQFNALGLMGLRVGSLKARNYLKVPIGHGEIHYEWIPLKSERILRIAIHFESSDRNVNQERLQKITVIAHEIAADVEYPFGAEDFGKLWTTAEFRMHWDETMPPESVAPEAVRIMRILIERTWQTVQSMMT